MKKFLLALFTTFCLATNLIFANPIIDKAYANKQSNIQVQGVGKVIKVLSDDNKGGAGLS